MAEDFADVAARKAADSARRSAMLALICVAVALAVLLIDNQIKRHILAAAAEARGYLDQFGVYAGQVMNGGQPAAGAAPVDAGSAGDPGGNDGPGVGDAAAGREDVAAAGRVVAPVTPKAKGGRAGNASGPRGDG